MPPVLWPASFNVAGDAFSGIGQKKAAMAVEILERDLGVTIRELKGSDIAYDVHVRRVCPKLVDRAAAVRGRATLAFGARVPHTCRD